MNLLIEKTGIIIAKQYCEELESLNNYDNFFHFLKEFEISNNDIELFKTRISDHFIFGTSFFVTKNLKLYILNALCIPTSRKIKIKLKLTQYK